MKREHEKYDLREGLSSLKLSLDLVDLVNVNLPLMFLFELGWNEKFFYKQKYYKNIVSNSIKK